MNLRRMSSTPLSSSSSPPPSPSSIPGARRPFLERVRLRSVALQTIRHFFIERGFLEVDTAQLVPGPGLEPHIDPLAVEVRTDLESAPVRRWLITSPELALKRVVAAGAQRVFQLGHVFRDGERTRRHCPEFLMLEWYRAGGSLDDLVRDHEELFGAVASALGVPQPSVPFARARVEDLCRLHAGIDLRAALTATAQGDASALVRAARAQGAMLRPGSEPNMDDAFSWAMTERVEPAIGMERPMVVERWPAQMAVLARRCDDDPLFAERFEVYAGGLELSNAFDELTDPVEQRARFQADNAARRALSKPELPLDEEFLTDLAHLPRTAGCALGVDRLLMFLLGAESIQDVVALPWR